MAVPAALRSVLAEVTAAPEEEAQVLDVEKEILDLCQAALPELVFGSLHRVGAFQLGVQEPKAELDLVFVLPEGSPSQPSQLLERLQQALPKATPSLPQGALNAPGLRWLHGSHGGTRSVQLFLAKDDKQPAGADTPSTAALYAKEVSSALMENVPSLESFRNLLKLVKHWAKRRGLYGNLFGFFNGMTWAVCCGRVCQDHPDAALDDLFHFFFQDLCRWDWSSPITLQGTQGTSNAPGSAPPNTLVLLPGNSHGRPPVPASGKVSEAVMRLVLRELRRAELKKLPELWAEHQFFNRHRHYIRFDFMASRPEILERWWVWGQQQLPELLHLFESVVDSKVLLRPWPIALDFKDASWKHAKAVCIGLHLQRTEKKSILDLREIMVKFLEMITAWPEAEAQMSKFELMIRAVTAEEMRAWLEDQGADASVPVAASPEHEAMLQPPGLGGYSPVSAAA